MAEMKKGPLSAFTRSPNKAANVLPIPPARQRLVIGNWKMHGDLDLCLETVSVLADVVTPQVGLVLCPPAPYLGEIRRLAQGTRLDMSAQNVAELSGGERTGEWSARMLAEVGCRYAIVGHSERRRHHLECDQLTAAKAQACLNAGITPVVCIGESQLERDNLLTEHILGRQLRHLVQIPGWREVVVAYEPVWAIGTGHAATPDEAQAAHAFIRACLAQTDPVAAAQISVLYGGSVNEHNAAALFAMPDVDGALVGRASLSPQALSRIYTAALRS